MQSSRRPRCWDVFRRALSNVADEGLLTEGFFWIPSLAGPTTLALQKSVRCPRLRPSAVRVHHPAVSLLLNRMLPGLDGSRHFAA